MIEYVNNLFYSFLYPCLFFIQEKVPIPLTTNLPTSSLIGSQLDDDSDDDDDGIQVTIGNIKSGASIFPPNRQNSRTTIPCK